MATTRSCVSPSRSKWASGMSVAMEGSSHGTVDQWYESAKSSPTCPWLRALWPPRGSSSSARSAKVAHTIVQATQYQKGRGRMRDIPKQTTPASSSGIATRIAAFATRVRWGRFALSVSGSAHSIDPTPRSIGSSSGLSATSRHLIGSVFGSTN